MARYIDADVFKKKLAEKDIFFPALYENELNETPTADVVSTKAFEQVKWERDTAIEQLESYGVGFCEDKELAEVKHGEWIYTGSCQVCSICDEEQYGVDTGRFYCPHCGAKMDGEKAITEIDHNSLCKTKTYKRSDT